MIVLRQKKKKNGASFFGSQGTVFWSLTRMNGCSRTHVVLCSEELGSVLIMSFLFCMLDAWISWSLDDAGRIAHPPHPPQG